MVAKTNEEKAMAYYWMGVGSNLLERPDDTITYQESSIREDPTNGHAYSSLAYAYLRKANYKKTFENATKCVEISPKYAWCYMALGEYYFAINNSQKGLENFYKAREIDPQGREIWDAIKSAEEFINTSKAPVPR